MLNSEDRTILAVRDRVPDPSVASIDSALCAAPRLAADLSQDQHDKVIRLDLSHVELQDSCWCTAHPLAWVFAVELSSTHLGHAGLDIYHTTSC